MEGYQHRGRRGRLGIKEQGLRSITGRYKIDRGGRGVKNSIGNGEAKELTCTTPGHELRREIAGREGGTRLRGVKRGILEQL